MNPIDRTPTSRFMTDLLTRRHLLATGAAALGVALVPTGLFAQNAPDERAEFFKLPRVGKFVLTLKPGDLDSLKKNPKKYVRAIARVNDKSTYQDVGVRLKGSSTSEKRGLDQKPSFSLNMDKFVDAQRLSGMDRLALEGSLKDPSYLNEMLTTDLYRAAGVPVGQVAHTALTLNGQVRGLYILKEGYDSGFLQKNFGNIRGNFYEGGDAKDIDQTLEIDGGDGEPDQNDLKKLVEACRDGNHDNRVNRMEESLQFEKFVSFVAMEAITANQSGYSMKRENYRIYVDLATKKINFIPTDLDNTWKPQATPGLFPEMNGLAARALLEAKPGREKVRARMEQLLKEVVTADTIDKRLAELQTRVSAGLATVDPAAAKEYPKAVEALRQMIKARLAAVAEELKKPAA